LAKCLQPPIVDAVMMEVTKKEVFIMADPENSNHPLRKRITKGIIKGFLFG
jgi:hypothetical protein